MPLISSARLNREIDSFARNPDMTACAIGKVTPVVATRDIHRSSSVWAKVVTNMPSALRCLTVSNSLFVGLLGFRNSTMSSAVRTVRSRERAMTNQELSKEEAERRAREVAQRMLTTPKPRKETSQKSRTEATNGQRPTQKGMHRTDE